MAVKTGHYQKDDVTFARSFHRVPTQVHLQIHLVFLVFLVQLQILMFLDGSLHKTLILDTVSDEKLESRNLQNLVKQYIPYI